MVHPTIETTGCPTPPPSIAGSTCPPPPSGATPPLITMFLNVTATLPVVNAGDANAAAVTNVTGPGNEPETPWNVRLLLIETPSSNVPAPIEIVSPLCAWFLASVIDRHGLAASVHVLVPPASLPVIET